MIHPVMPFITEELWHAMQERGPQETIMFQPSPKPVPFDADLLMRFEIAQETVNAVRAIRQQKNIAPKEPLNLLVKSDFPAGIAAVIRKLANVGEVSVADDFGAQGTGVSQMIRTFEIFVPLGNLVNVDEEIAKLSAELERQQGFLASVRKKLANEAFVAHAPEKIVALERKKESDSLSKIESLEQAINALKNNV